MNHAIRVALFVALAILGFGVVLPALADECRPPACDYIRSGQVGNDHWVYWWYQTQYDVGYDYRLYLAADQGADFYIGAVARDLGMLPGHVVRPIEVAHGDPRAAHIETDMRAAMALDTHKPLIPRWIVPGAVGGISSGSSQLTYPVVSGFRGSVPVGRVASGTVCNCRLPIIEGLATYCQVPPNPLVALCARVAP